MSQTAASVYQCPGCEKLYSDGGFSRSIANKILYPDKKYSDGKYGDNRRTFITKCTECQTIFWLDWSNGVGRYGDGYNTPNDEVLRSWEDADRPKKLDLDGYLSALNKNNCKTKDQELCIREDIMLLFNDRVRTGGIELFTSEEEKDIWEKNNLRLLEILDEKNINHRLLIAEVHRYLGNFEKCEEIINDKTSFGRGWPIVRFRRACQRKETLVFEIDDSYL